MRNYIYKQNIFSIEDYLKFLETKTQEEPIKNINNIKNTKAFKYIYSNHRFMCTNGKVKN